MSSIVMVIDDDDANRAVIKDVLVDAGFDVRDYATSAEARGDTLPSDVSLVILDSGEPFPGSDAPIVVVSAGGDVPAQAERLGARAWLRKPFAIDDLVELVRANAA